MLVLPEGMQVLNVGECEGLTGKARVKLSEGQKIP